MPVGTPGSDVINGNLLNELYLGLAGDDSLIGSQGSDTLDGGSGTDVADYSNIGTFVTIKAFGELLKGSFIDRLVSIETIIGSSLMGDTVDLSGAIAPATNTIANLNSGLIEINGPNGVLLVNGIPLRFKVSQFENVIGSNFNDTITGNSSNNILNGGAGIDIMIGGAGNDTYVVDNAGDVVTETAGSGTDAIQSSITYTLSANLENLTLTGAAAINGTGNSLDNTITGNGAINNLSGGDGNDILDGGASADIMAGGLGNDTYVVDNIGDVVTEAAGAGTDTIQSSITYTLGANLENLTLSGAAAINGTGNELNNTIKGNGANNILTGGLSSDTLTGGLGIDTFMYNTLADSAFGALNRDTITDFLLGVDKLDLSAIDANLSIAGNQAFTFIGLIGGIFGSPVFSTAGQLGYQVSGGNLFLYGNVDGDSNTAEFELRLSGLTSITAANIIL
jgi:Ca2+-binding RTX toxin-like protein